MNKIAFRKQIRTFKNGFIIRLVFQYWWVILFVLMTHLFYHHALQKKQVTFLSLENDYSCLSQKKESALQEKQDLLLKINSQSDPEWIQMTLMKNLGVVPEGQIKVFFNN